MSTLVDDILIYLKETEEIIKILEGIYNLIEELVYQTIIAEQTGLLTRMETFVSPPRPT
jgi:sulfur transfer complex TusBCD TusB component (DsrH family)